MKVYGNRMAKYLLSSSPRCLHFSSVGPAAVGSLPSGFMQCDQWLSSQKQGSRDLAMPCQSSPLHPTLAYLLPQSPIVRAFFKTQDHSCAFNLTFGAPTGPTRDQHYLSW